LPRDLAGFAVSARESWRGDAETYSAQQVS
jgi:hypothetical protein